MLSTFVFCFLFLIFATANSNSKGKEDIPLLSTSAENFTPYRYTRYLFFSFSENVTAAYFEEVIEKQLSKFDMYCGGENYLTKIIFGSKMVHSCNFCSLSFAFQSKIDYNKSIAQGIAAGAIDHTDVNNVSATIMQQISDLQQQPMMTMKQVILITDYAIDSITNISNFLAVSKSENVKFIALTENLADGIAMKYFPKEIWNVFPNYINWTTQGLLAIPICGDNSSQYTTPTTLCGSIRKDLTMLAFAYLMLSLDYVQRTKLKDVVDFLHQLTLRRWLSPCRQYRTMQFLLITQSSRGHLEIPNLCVADDALAKNTSISSGTKLCSKRLFDSNVSDKKNWWPAKQNVTCNILYEDMFQSFIRNSKDGVLPFSKYLIITDLPLPCQTDTYTVLSTLHNYTEYSCGAPLTVIAIDKENDKSVASSYAPLFPVTQRPNLYEVNNMSQILQNINKSINFCLDTVPWLDERKLPYHQAVWYFYLIGAVILIAFTVCFAFLVIRRSKKRRERLEQIRKRSEMITTINQITQKDHSQKSVIKDEWEVSLNTIDINYITILGKGAFSIVHSGYLHGKAPVLDIFPSIALQEFSDCNVAVKTVPQHSSESDRAQFRDEIRLMKEIGFNVHLVSMLGCNCSIERPFLLMEVAKQDLLHWLTHNRAPASEAESKLEKTLLSISWQVADGMNYLAAKHFVHRDLAARNVLLNNEMKAMVTDFGLCQKLENAEQVLTITAGMVPIKWMAIESLLDRQFSLKSDVWSFGVLLYEIFGLGKEPYAQVSSDSLINYLQKGSRLNKPRFANNQMYYLMKHCWQTHPSQRPTMFEIQSVLQSMIEGTVDANYGYLQTSEEKSIDNHDP